MIATKYNENMTDEEFTKGFKTVFAMAAHYAKLGYESAGSRLSSEYYGEYYDARPDLAEALEAAF